MAQGRLFKAVETFLTTTFFYFSLLFKNGLRMALGRLFEAVETFSPKHFSQPAYFLKMALESLWDTYLRLRHFFPKIFSPSVYF